MTTLLLHVGLEIRASDPNPVFNELIHELLSLPGVAGIEENKPTNLPRADLAIGLEFSGSTGGERLIDGVMTYLQQKDGVLVTSMSYSVTDLYNPDDS